MLGPEACSRKKTHRDRALRSGSARRDLYVILLVKRQKTELSSTERTSIRIVQPSVLVRYLRTKLHTGASAASAPAGKQSYRTDRLANSSFGRAPAGQAERSARRQEPQNRTKRSGGRWNVISVIGPLGRRMADLVFENWSSNVRGVIPKAAKGEAICDVFSLDGYIDFKAVFGS